MIDFLKVRKFILALILLVGLVNCSSQGATKTSLMELAGTQWELLAIHSMDDAQRTTLIDSKTRITVNFSVNGHVSFLLDCNRGTATWQSTLSNDGVSGTLQFSSIAATRAMCLPPHLDERVLRDLKYVRSYLFKDGKLFMSLLADGGIYEWLPAMKSVR